MEDVLNYKFCFLYELNTLHDSVEIIFLVFMDSLILNLGETLKRLGSIFPHLVNYIYCYILEILYFETIIIEFWSDAAFTFCNNLATYLIFPRDFSSYSFSFHFL